MPSAAHSAFTASVASPIVTAMSAVVTGSFVREAIEIDDEPLAAQDADELKDLGTRGDARSDRPRDAFGRSVIVAFVRLRRRA